MGHLPKIRMPLHPKSASNINTQVSYNVAVFGIDGLT